MRQTADYREVDAVINFHKPRGVTSADCVNYVKKILNVKKVGHGGTLDPFASGVLPIGINRGTKILQSYVDGSKVYTGHAKAGYSTDTLDLEGVITDTGDDSLPSEAILKEHCLPFLGELEQETPAFSARKIGGKKLYELARAGVAPEKRPVKSVVIYEFQVMADETGVNFLVECSKGTYIRQLLFDYLKSMTLHGHLDRLVRSQVADLKITDSITPFELASLSVNGVSLEGKWLNLP
jgi:tRNA pseudouridine55 synthase